MGVAVTIPSNLPEVSIIGGPHLVKISDPNSANYGRVFLINDNNRSRLNLDDSRLESGETIESVFTAGTIVEVVRAPTLGNVLGADLPDLPTNWTMVMMSLPLLPQLIGFIFPMVLAMKGIIFSMFPHMKVVGLPVDGDRLLIRDLNPTIIWFFFLMKLFW